MAETSSRPQHPVRLADLEGRKDHQFQITPSATARAEIAAELDISGVKKLRFEGRLMPLGRKDWRLEAKIGATVVQPCVVTLEPVTTRIDEAVTRNYVADMAEPEPGEVEMPEDDETDPLPAVLDLAEVMIEALALALPHFPRAQNVSLGSIQVTEPGKAAMSDEDARPFAGLASLRKTLENNGNDDD